MKDVIPEETPKNAKVEKYTNQIDIENERTIFDKFFIWLDSCDFSFLSKQNWFLWSLLIGASIAIYRKWDIVLKIWNHFT